MPRPSKIVAALTLAASPLAAAYTTLFVASSSGNVSTYYVAPVLQGFSQLSNTANSTHCGSSPSWLTLDPEKKLLYCLDRGNSTSINGSITSFSVDGAGRLRQQSKATNVLPGGVSSTLYASGRGMAVAHYDSSSLSSWFVGANGSLTLNQNLHFELPSLGPVAASQNASHPYQVVTDPTGQYILVPDLGADLIRVFTYDDKTLALKPLTPLQVTHGSGPRHAAFWTSKNNGTTTPKTYLYVVHELSSTVTGYAITYLPNGTGLEFTPVHNSSTYGSATQPLPGNAPAEIQITPDNKSLIISNRAHNNATAANSTSDWMVTFAIHEDSGKLELSDTWPSGGASPRHFSFNAKGDLAAVGNEKGGNVVVSQKAEGGKFTEVARTQEKVQPVCVLFYETE